MANNDDLNLDVEAEKPKGGKFKLLLIILLALLLVAGIAGGVLYVMSGDGGEGADAGPAPLAPLIYREITPALVVNFEGPGRIRYVQVGVVISARTQGAIDAVDRHMPVIRNNLIMLFSGKTYEELNSREGKEQARDEVLETVRQVLREHTGDNGVESVYFTSFVMQ